MKRKIALKRLSSSDLTLFEHHYRHTAGTKQKAINLDAAVFVDAFYPGLPARLGVGRDRIIVVLTVFGPSGAGPHSITRKILKQQKNWRLNGELISDPPEEPGRYSSLEKGDYAILDFAGDSEPHTARMCLVAGANEQDAKLHAALQTAYGASFSQRIGFIEIDPDDFARTLSGLNLPDGHPALDFVDFDDLEDAAQGGLEGISKLRVRRKARGVNREELARAKQGAEWVGRKGEELLNTWLELQRLAKKIPGFRWDSDTNAISPYDFSILDGEAVKRRIDAKSTAGDFTNPIHVSLAELKEMAQGGVPYDLYRLYSVTETSARLRIASDVGMTASQLLGVFSQLPKEVTVDGVSIHPEYLKFSEEEIIDFGVDQEAGNAESDLFDE